MRNGTLNWIVAAIAALLIVNAAPASAQHTAEQALLNRSVLPGSNLMGPIEPIAASDIIEEAVDGTHALLGRTAHGSALFSIPVAADPTYPSPEEALLGRIVDRTAAVAGHFASARFSAKSGEVARRRLSRRKGDG